MWVRRTIWHEGDRYEAADNADISQVINDALVLAANKAEAITVHVGSYALEVEPDADPAILRSTVEKSSKAAKKRAAKKAKAAREAKKPVAAKRPKKAAVKKAPAKKVAKKAAKRTRR